MELGRLTGLLREQARSRRLIDLHLMELTRLPGRHAACVDTYVYRRQASSHTLTRFTPEDQSRLTGRLREQARSHILIDLHSGDYQAATQQLQ